MKKTTLKICSMALTLALSFGCMAGLAGCGEEEVTPPPEHHHTFATAWTNDATGHWHAATCEHTAEVSGKEAHRFTDGNCTVCGYTDPNYVPAPVLVSHYFETEDPHLDDNEGEWMDWGLGTENFAAARFEMDLFDDCAPTSYNFALNAEKAGAAKVFIRIKSLKTEMNLKDKGFEMTFNDDPVDVTAVVPAATAANYDLFTSAEGFSWVELADVELIAGANNIDFFTSVNKHDFAIDKIDVQAEGDVTWFDDGNHYCEHWCASCRNCMDPDCEETGCKQKGKSQGSIRKKNDSNRKCNAAGTTDEYVLEAEAGDAVRTSGMQVVTADGESAGYAVLTKNSSVTFNMTVESPQRAAFRIRLSKPAQTADIFDLVSFTVDGKDVKDWNPRSNVKVSALAQDETAATAFAEINFGCLWFVGGAHTVTVTLLADTTMNLDGLTVYFRNNLTLGASTV